eukprot:jgi/Chlat1/8045/Chrsp73S07518
MACGQRGLRGLLAVQRQLAAAAGSGAGVRHAATFQQRSWHALAAAASSRMLPPSSHCSLAFPQRSFVFQPAQPYCTESSAATTDAATTENNFERRGQRDFNTGDEWYRQAGVPCLYVGGIPLRGNCLPQLMSMIDDGSTRMKMRVAYDSDKMKEASANNPGTKYFFTKGFGFLYVESEERAQQIMEKLDNLPVTFFKNITRTLKVQKALNPMRAPSPRRQERAEAGTVSDEPNITTMPVSEGTDQPASSPGHAVVTPETTNSEEVVEAALDASMSQTEDTSPSSTSSEDKSDEQQQQQQSASETLTPESEATTDETTSTSADSNKAS